MDKDFAIMEYVGWCERQIFIKSLHIHTRIHTHTLRMLIIATKSHMMLLESLPGRFTWIIMVPSPRNLELELRYEA